MVSERPIAVLENLSPTDYGLPQNESQRPSAIGQWFSKELGLP